MISRRCSDYLTLLTQIGKSSMLLTDFQLLQPIVCDGIVGYINFICEDYVTMTFMDEPLPASMNSRWGRHQVAMCIYPQDLHKVRVHLTEDELNRSVLHRTSDSLANHHRRNNKKFGSRPAPDRNSRSHPYK